jgi:predicted NACHT family NTPase
MLEWLAGFVFGSILKEIGKEAAKDWLKDFFKSVPGQLSQHALTFVLPSARKKALKAFLALFQKELAENGLNRQEIKQYRDSLTRFRQQKTIQQTLGSAFLENCQAISPTLFAREWQALNLKPLPDGFNWELIATPYYREVRQIRRDNAELRAILDSENLERLARNAEATAKALQSLTGIIPEFDLQRYRESLVENYGTLKLSAVDCTHDQYRMRLWNLFIPQNVREALPPSRYEIPKELEGRLRDAGRLEADFSLMDAQRYRESYLQKPARSVLEALQETRYAVILGDPGAGKSTLLQYLALSRFEAFLPDGERETSVVRSDGDIFAGDLPLLVELRRYAADSAKPGGIVEFFHKGNSTIQKLNQENLHELLKTGRGWVLLDGLDEVFDPVRRDEVVTEIFRLTNEYPKVRVVVTSRIIGYNPERLRDAGFVHMTLQELEPEQVESFIQLWYDFALENEEDRSFLKQRLREAIANSKALTELAGNPLLLTMMAILNRRQELPRDRATLYDEASKVLLYTWDIDHKRLQLPADAIARQEKQAILRKVAYTMQAGEKGLKGNIIERDTLLALVTQFLLERSFSQP